MITNFSPDTPTGVGIFIAAIAILIIVHELGHFIAARLVKVEVEEFGLGFPPRMVKLFTWKGTLFSLNWLPIGGFVRPKGENDPNVEGGLAAANPWARIFVLLSGPAMNFLAASMLLTLLFMRIGHPVTDKVIIINVAANSPAANAGLMPDDLVVDINGREIDSTDKLYNTILANLDKEVDLTYLRDGELVTVSLVPRSEPPEGEGFIGILMGNPRAPTKIGKAAVLSVDAIFSNMRALISLPSRIIRGTMAPSEGRLVGFKGMYDMYAQMDDVDNIIGFFASISVSLGLLNLFPIPGLDGGRILFSLPEIILRRRIPQRYEEALNFISISLLLIMMFYVNLQDFLNPLDF